mmetsp:Transcript_2903/g.8242  ORF Transcript_2903/g.8242 Transcript_2903/m.8242 type:complete len:238 (+) Transcript_2903:486-1199(+)
MDSESWSKSLLLIAAFKRPTTLALVRAFGEASPPAALASISSMSANASSISLESKNASSARVTARLKASSSFVTTARFKASRARCLAAARRPSSRPSLSSAGRRPAARPEAIARSTSLRSGGSFTIAAMSWLNAAFCCGVCCRRAVGGGRGVIFGTGRGNFSEDGGTPLALHRMNTGCGSIGCRAFWNLIRAPRSPPLSSAHTQLEGVAPMSAAAEFCAGLWDPHRLGSFNCSRPLL